MKWNPRDLINIPNELKISNQQTIYKQYKLQLMKVMFLKITMVHIENR